MEIGNVECKTCKIKYNISQFISITNGTQTKNCLNCRMLARKERERNPVVLYIKQLKTNMPPCVFCGDSNIDHLEFDHIDRSLKTGTIFEMKNFESLFNELKNVRSLCRKCHRKITNKENHYITTDPNYKPIGTLSQRRAIYDIPALKRNREYVNNLKLNIAKCSNPNCEDIFDPDNLTFYEFDHINPFTKVATISKLVHSSKSIEDINKELIKCQLLCGYCHIIKTRFDKEIMRNYYSNLTEPLVKEKREKLIRTNKFTQEDAKDMRILYNEYELSQVEISYLYNTISGVVEPIINNRSHIDPNYQKTRFRFLTKEQYEIRNAQLRYDRDMMKMSYVDMQEKYNLSKGAITNAIGIKTLTLDQQKARNQEIIKDFHAGMNRKELCKKYNLKTSAISDIITSLAAPRKKKQEESLKRNEKVRHERELGFTIKLIAEMNGIHSRTVQKILSGK